MQLSRTVRDRGTLGSNSTPHIFHSAKVRPWGWGGFTELGEK